MIAGWPVNIVTDVYTTINDLLCWSYVHLTSCLRVCEGPAAVLGKARVPGQVYTIEGALLNVAQTDVGRETGRELTLWYDNEGGRVEW